VVRRPVATRAAAACWSPRTAAAIVEFGVSGGSIGCASWSGVVYLPIAPARALEPDEFILFEVVVQGL
jgi:hypothetical protein